MKRIKNKASGSCIVDKQYKLNDFCEGLGEFRFCDEEIEKGVEGLDKQIDMLVRDGCTEFKSNFVVCPECGSHRVSKDGFITRKLVFLNKGEQDCRVQRYECPKCGKKFQLNLESIVDKNSNITRPVIEKILQKFSRSGSSIYNIQYSMKEDYNVDISISTIENIILGYCFINEVEPWSCSGYYLFDSLWVKCNGPWNYLLVLFDDKLNIPIAFKLVESETEEVIMDFIKKATRNQPHKCITTDLKLEYQRAIWKLDFKHQFCRFHIHQKIKNDIENYFKGNKTSSEDKKIIKQYKKELRQIINAETIEFAKEKLKELQNKTKELPEIIKRILWKFIIPYFKNITQHLKDFKVSSTNNKIENFFRKTFPKHIKRRMKTELGILTRFALKIRFWNTNNKKDILPQSFV